MSGRHFNDFTKCDVDFNESIVMDGKFCTVLRHSIRNLWSSSTFFMVIEHHHFGHRVPFLWSSTTIILVFEYPFYGHRPPSFWSSTTFSMVLEYLIYIKQYPLLRCSSTPISSATTAAHRAGFRDIACRTPGRLAHGWSVCSCSAAGNPAFDIPAAADAGIVAGRCSTVPEGSG
jgi:hypothetical protein